jgi:hypothetical protein
VEPQEECVFGAEPRDAPSEERGPPDQQPEPQQEPADNPDGRDQRDEPVACRSRVGDEPREQRERGERRP